MKNKIIKLSIISVFIIIIAVLLVLIYNAFFSSNVSNRNNDIENYKITNNEINAVTDRIKEIDQVQSVDIHTNNNSKIIKIVVTLTEDVALNTIKTTALEAISYFSEENKSYYDFEFFVDSLDSESEIYPKIGYKFRHNSEFSW